MSPRATPRVSAGVFTRLKQLFGQKSATYNQFPESMFQTYYYTTPGKPVWMKREFKKFADEAYIKNVIAHRSVSLIAMAAASIPLKLAVRSGAERRAMPEHPVLRLLKHPSPCGSGSAFMEAIYSYRLISGNAFVQMIRPGGEAPTELHVLRPDRMSIIPGAACLPEAYVHTLGQHEQRFPVDPVSGKSDILHVHGFHPLDDWFGLSPVEAAAFSIDQHNQASAWNQALLQNGARPSGALVVQGGKDGGTGTLSDEQYLRIKQQMEEQFTGTANAGRPLLLEGGLDWREMSHSPKDMDFLESKHSAARDIALAFGVPPQLLGIPGDNTYSNLAEARVALWEQTILPHAQHVISALGHWLAPYYGGEIELTLDIDDIAALSPRREALWQRVNNSTFLSTEEKRQAVGLPPVEQVN